MGDVTHYAGDQCPGGHYEETTVSDRDYLYGHVCAHGSLARSCEVCDLEDLLDAVQEALTWAEAPVRYDGGYLSLAERIRWLHLRGRDRHRERDEARAEVRRLREERRGMVAESSWDGLAEELTEVEADNARLRAAIREHDRRYTLDGGGRARCYPVMGELLSGDDDE